MLCPICGKEMSGNSCNFCGYTAPGAAQPQPQPQQYQQFQQPPPQYYQQPGQQPMYQQPVPQPPKKKHTLLWVLGWIFIFPVPLTILMLRNKKLDNKLRYGVIAAGWTVYLIFALVGRVGNSSSHETLPVDDTASTAVTATTTVTTAPTTTAPPAETEEVTTTTAPETTAEPETTTTKKAKKKKKTTTTKAEPEEPTDDEIRKSVNDGDYSLVTPEFKELMDSYEAFYDKYIEFMNNYNSGEGDIMQMMSDYTDMMAQMDEWSRKIDEIDESTLSPADDAYFLLVTLRIEQKLLGAI